MDIALYLPYITLGMLLLSAVLLIVVLLRQSRHARGEKRRQQLLMDGLAQVDGGLQQDGAQWHGETMAAIRDGNRQLSGTVAAMGQSQATLLEGLQRQQSASARNQQEVLHQSLSRLDAQMEQLRQSTQQSLTALRQDNDRQLTEMRRTVDEKLTQSLDRRLNESFAQVSQRLEQVYKGLGEMQTLASGVGDLKKVLAGVKTRGSWGEMQLGALLSQLLAPGQYEENAQVVPGSSERVEFALRLPGREDGCVYLPIDSKFPQEDYLRLTEASQAADREAVAEARKALALRIKTEAKRISGKYVAPPHTTDFAVMFLPVEGLYAEVTQTPGLVETLQQEYRVVPAGPSTFSALLNALQMGFRTLAIEQRTGEVWQLLAAVKKDFGLFAETLEKTRQRIRQAGESIDTAFTRTRSIQRKLGAVELLDGENTESPEETP